MRILANLSIILFFYACKPGVPQLENFPINFEMPLIEGDPLKVYWDLQGYDSIKLDNDVFYTSDTAYYYVGGMDIMKIKVYDKESLVFDKHVRYQVSEGPVLGLVKTQSNPIQRKIPSNFLGFSMVLSEVSLMIGFLDRYNEPFMNLLKGLYDSSKVVPIYIQYHSTSVKDNHAFQSLNLLAQKLLEDDYKVQYSFELPDKASNELLQKIDYNIDHNFVHAYVLSAPIKDESIQSQLKLSGKKIIYDLESFHQKDDSLSLSAVLLKQNYTNVSCKNFEDEIQRQTNLKIAQNESDSNSSYARWLHISLPNCENVIRTMNGSLWLLDFLMKQLESGTDQVFISLNGMYKKNNQVVEFEIPKNHLLNQSFFEEQKAYPDKYLVKKINPSFYSFWILTDLLHEGNQIEKVLVDSPIVQLSAYRITTPAQKIKYLLINRDDSTAGSAFIYDTIIYRSWNSRWVAPNHPTLVGMNYGGRSFEGSYDGSIRGSYYTDKIVARKLGNRIPLPAASAVLVQSKHY